MIDDVLGSELKSQRQTLH